MSVNSPIANSISEFVSDKIIQNSKYTNMCSEFNSMSIEDDSNLSYSDNETIENLNRDSDEETTDTDMPDLVSDNEDTDEETGQENNKLEMVYLVKLNEKIITYGTTFDEVNNIVEYVVDKTSSKYRFLGYDVHKDNTLKILNNNIIITNVYGTNRNSIMTHEQLLFTVSIHIIPRYTKEHFDKIKL